jgi:hypothetical protein
VVGLNGEDALGGVPESVGGQGAQAAVVGSHTNVLEDEGTCGRRPNRQDGWLESMVWKRGTDARDKEPCSLPVLDSRHAPHVLRQQSRQAAAQW